MMTKKLLSSAKRGIFRQLADTLFARGSLEVQKRRGYHPRKNHRLQFETLDGRQLCAVDTVATMTLSALPESPVAVGTSVAFTATKPGANDLEYLFKVRGSDTEWATTRSYSTDNGWLWDTSTLESDVYFVAAFSRPLGSTNAYESFATPLRYLLTNQEPVSSVTMAASQLSVVVGESTTITAIASGGGTEVEYAFRMRSTTGDWSLVQSYSTDGTFVFDTTEKSPDTYFITAMARNRGSLAPYEAIGTSIAIQVLATPPLTNLQMTADSRQVSSGNSILFTTLASEDLTDYEVAYRMRSSTGEWQIQRAYSLDKTWSWNTTGVAVGNYFVHVYVKHITSGAKFEYQTVPIKVEVTVAAPLPSEESNTPPETPPTGTPPTEISTTSNKTRAVAAGELVTFGAVATGGTLALEYQFRYRSKTGNWTVLRDYSTNDTFVWDTTNVPADTYFIGAYFRAIGSTASFEYAATPVTQQIFPQVPVPVRQTINSVITVAASDAPEAVRNSADFVASAIGSQAAINAAIAALPASGGVIQLTEGTFTILHTDGTLGGINIDRSNVIFQGRGNSTRLILADNQNTNVIRIIGDGLSNVTIRDLYINGNWKNNYTTNFEGNGIKAKSTTSTPMSNITVEQCWVEDSARLNIMLDASNARIVNNRLGDSRSDSVEILTGPGFIQNNYAEIDEITGYVLSSDAANEVTISNNIVKVLSTGIVSQSIIRTWTASVSHVITNNQIEVRGRATRMVEVNGYVNVISNNIFAMFGNQTTKPTVDVNGASIVNANIFLATDLVFNNTSSWPSIVSNNFFMSESELRNTTNPESANDTLLVQNNQFA